MVGQGRVVSFSIMFYTPWFFPHRHYRTQHMGHNVPTRTNVGLHRQGKGGWIVVL